MIFIDRYDSSFWPKFLVSSCILITLFVCLWLLFAGYMPSSIGLEQYQLSGNPLRRLILAVCLIIYFVRLMITVWVFQKRHWTWSETLIIAIFMSFVLYAFTRVGGNNEQSVGMVEVIGILLYLAGSYLNTHSEYARHVWKSKAENRGHLYTQGFFSLSMHINYFGDLVLFTGFVMIAARLSLLVIPLFMAANFIFNIIPSLDRYLETKYKEAFRQYASKTKKLIPLVY